MSDVEVRITELEMSEEDTQARITELEFEIQRLKAVVGSCPHGRYTYSTVGVHETCQHCADDAKRWNEARREDHP